MEIQIRLVEVEDAARVAVLSGQLGYPCDAAAMAGRIGHVLQSHNERVCVAVVGDVVVAWMHVSRLFHLESGEFAEIVGLVVDEGQRGHGIGRRLVAEAVAWAKHSGMPRLVVRSNVVRQDTHRFYLKLGFREKKEQKYFLQEL